MSEMLDQVKSFHSEMKAAAAAAAAPEEKPELPEGAAPVEDIEDKTEKIEPPVEEPAKVEEPPAPKVEEPETLIRIGSQTFKTQAEAIRYAEQLEINNLVSEAHQQGIRDALAAQAPAAAPVEDDFDAKFYADPKGTLQSIKEQAKTEALQAVQAEKTKENLWRTFEEKYPDIDRRDAELILQQNMDTIGKMTQVDKAMELLAQRTRSEYQRIVERYKPRQELHPSKGTSTIPSTSAKSSVTPKKSDEPVLTLSQQLSKVRAQKRNASA